MVRRHDIPGRIFVVAAGHRHLVRFSVGVPIAAFLDVGPAELPPFFGIVQSRLQPLALLLLADVQEHLDDRRAAFVEHLLELVDSLVAAFPFLLGHEIVDANHQHVFVVRTVEDADEPLARRRG